MSLDATGQAVLVGGLVAIIVLTVLAYFNGRACWQRRASSRERKMGLEAHDIHRSNGSAASAKGTSSSCWPWGAGSGEDDAGEDEDEEGHESGYEMDVSKAPPAGVGDAFAGWDDTDDDTDDGGAGKRRNWAALDAGQARAAQEREALAAAAIRLQANARRGGEQDGPHDRKKRVSFGDPDEDPNAALPGSPTTGEWFGMDSINPRQSSDPAGAFGVGPEREQGFGFSARTSAVGPGPSAARRSSDFNISIEPGPGTPDHGTLIHAEPDVGQKRHSYVGVENMSAIKRAQDERRSQLNGGKAGGAYTGSQRYAGTHAAIAGASAPDGNDFYDDLSNASAPPAAALTPGNPADKAQRKAALERERVAAAVAWEDDQRRAQQRAAGAAAAPVEKSNSEAEAELRATSDHMHRIRAAASMRKYGAPPSYGVAPKFEGELAAAPAAVGFDETGVRLDSTNSSVRSKSVKPLYPAGRDGGGNGSNDLARRTPGPEEPDRPESGYEIGLTADYGDAGYLSTGSTGSAHVAAGQGSSGLPPPPPPPPPTGPVVITLTRGPREPIEDEESAALLPPAPPTPDTNSLDRGDGVWDWGLPAPPPDPVSSLPLPPPPPPPEPLAEPLKVQKPKLAPRRRSSELFSISEGPE